MLPLCERKLSVADLPLTTWRDAEKSDRGALNAFVCTDPPKPRYDPSTRQTSHPKPWEYRVQTMIRAARAPLPRGHRMLLGEDDEGIAWACIYEELAGPEVVELKCLAVSVRHRGKGGVVAQEMAHAVLEALTQAAIEAQAEVAAVHVETQVWHENIPSKRFCDAAGLVHTGWAAPGFMLYGRRLPVAGATLDVGGTL